MTDTTPTLPLLDYQIAYYRTELEMERISYGDLADIDAVFDLIDTADLPEPAENATASDKLDEIQERTIVTLEGLDALPVGARIVMREGFTLHKVDEVEWVDEGSSMAYGTDEIMGGDGDGETLLPGLVISHGVPAGVTPTPDFHQALADLATNFPDVVFAYFERDEFTLPDEDNDARPVTDAEWEIITADFDAEVYGAVDRSETIYYAVERARAEADGE